MRGTTHPTPSPPESARVVGGAVERHPTDAVALVGAGTSWTFGRLRAFACEVGERSAGWGARGDTVALVGDSVPHTVAMMHALCAAGWTVGVLDPGWTHDEVTAALSQLGAAAMIARDEHAAGCGGWTQVDRVDGWSVRTPAPGVPVHPGMRSAPTDRTPFYVGFTSGSSGVPKAFVRDHGSWWESFAGLDRCVPLGDGAVVVPGALSSSHFLFGALHGLHAGRTVELLPAGPTALAQRLNDGGAIAALYVVPTMLKQLLEAVQAPPVQPQYLFCAGARLDPEVRDRTAERLPASGIVEYYGASELSFVAIQTPGDGTPRGAVGRAFPGVEIAICDEQDAPVAAGVTGRIFVRSRLVFDGYRGRGPVSAARAIRGGWLTVGDLGHLDADGNLFVAGRGSALIITGGTNVQPEEVEGALAGCAGVADCAVVGTPDPHWGEVVVAVVVPREDAQPTRAALRAHLSATLGRAKRPRRYVMIDRPLPTGRTGKVDRAAVRELVLAGAGREL